MNKENFPSDQRVERIPVEMILPADIDWDKLGGESRVQDDSGLTVVIQNPEAYNLDWEKVDPKRIKTRNTNSWSYHSIPVVEIGKHVQDLSSEYIIPGYSFVSYFNDHPEKIPDCLKGMDYNFLFGTLRKENGKWVVPYTLYDDRENKFETPSSVDVHTRMTQVNIVLVER